jgi:hypothetical protein
MHRLTLTFIAMLAGCNRMDPGPIGKPLDLRQYLPDSLRSASARGDDSTFRHQIVLGPGNARIEMTWMSFRHGAGRYLSTVSARLGARASYDSITIGEPSELRNVGSKFRPIESATVRIGWFRRTVLGQRAGVTNFQFGADGRRFITSNKP